MVSRAATAFIAAEVESGTTITLPASVGNDATASAGKAVTFKAGSVTPPSSRHNCIVKPSDCGYPDETNTGVPAGTTLTSSGTITVTKNGAIIENKDIRGQVMVQANNVTIRKSRITSGDYYPIRYDNPYRGLVVEDSEIASTGTDGTAAMSFGYYTARRLNVHGAADGFKADNSATIEDSYIHDLAITAESHNDGVQTTGGSNVTLRHSTCILKEGGNACIQFGSADSGWLITDNLFSGGGWTLNGGQGQTYMTVTNNRFTREHGYGPGSLGSIGLVWTGNYYDDNGVTIKP